MESKKKSHWKGRTIAVAVVIAGIGGGVWYWLSRGPDGPQYQTAEVTRGDVVQMVTATGDINPVLTVQVGSQISGTIAKLYADFNSHVTNGQVVAQIDPATYQANVRQAEGDLVSAKASLALAKVNAGRAKELLDSQLVPQADYDQATATLAQAEAAVMLKEATLERARTDLARCTIYSPVDGVVLSRNVDVGQTVAASLSAPTLFIIANDLTKMQIDAFVAEADIGAVEEKQAVDFTVDAFPYRTFHGTVIQIRNSPTNSQSVVSYDTVISAANPDLKLRPGMTANVSIIIARRDNVLRVPNAAFRFHPPGSSTNTPPAQASRPQPDGRKDAAQHRPKGERKMTRTVYVLRNNQPQPVTIKVGITDSVYTEVLEGLSETDQIVTAALVETDSDRPSNPFAGRMRFH